MKALLLTNEYPPTIYGGAGVHVDYMSRELSRLIDVDVRAFGDQNVAEPGLRASGFGVEMADWHCDPKLRSILGALDRCVAFNAAGTDADVVHCHTWYTHFGGMLAKMTLGIPLVITVHSLEPLRPWKREQLGGGYDFSCWVERAALEMADAVIAVSNETGRDILNLFRVPPERLHVIHNGIDLDEYRPVAGSNELGRFGIDLSSPYLLFVGRITRQKGIIHLVNAIRHFAPGFQVVLCAGAPDTPEIAAEMKAAVAAASAVRPGVIWIEEMVSRETAIQLYSHAALFCCPSIYEPFGIINLEAMSCGTAVVASAVGGIPEVVENGETGLLVPVEQMGESPYEPVDPERFSHDLATATNALMADPDRRAAMGKAGRERAGAHFAWSAIAAETVALYRDLLGT
jgi:glycogen synthase